MKLHTVNVWRNDYREWCHNFVHRNGKVLSRQSEPVKRKDTVWRSAVTSYGIDPLKLTHIDETEEYTELVDDTSVDYMRGFRIRIWKLHHSPDNRMKNSS